jgi:hypothetical protein
MKKDMFLYLFVFYISFSCAQNAQELTELKGDYLGQTPPDDTPVVFARDLVSSENQEHGATVFSPDGNEVFWWVNDHGEGRLMTMRRISNRWTVPEIASLKRGLPIYSIDGKRLYLGGEDAGSPYFVEKQGTSWGEIQPLGIIDRFPEVQATWFLSVTKDKTLYIFGKIKGYGLWNDYGLFRTELINGEYSKPEVLPSEINHPGCMNWTPFIAPDESFLIFSSGRNKSNNDLDLYICFRQSDGSWTNPDGLGETINTPRQERYPTLSPDGKYLFFTRDNPPYDEDVFWVSARIIDEIKHKSLSENKE